MEDLKLWTVTYTKHNPKKRKVYQDGFLELHISTNKAKLYDDCKKLLDCRILKRCEVVRGGETLTLNAYLVDIGEPSKDRRPLSRLNSYKNDAKFTETSGGRKDNSIKKKVRLTLSPSQKIIREFKRSKLQSYGSPQSSQQEIELPVAGNFQSNVVQRKFCSKLCFYSGDETKSSGGNKPLRDSLEILSTLRKPMPRVRIAACEIKETITTAPSPAEPKATEFVMLDLCKEDQSIKTSFKFINLDEKVDRDRTRITTSIKQSTSDSAGNEEPKSASRRLRAFKRWMKSEDVQYSNALQFTDSIDEGISVRALCDLKEGDVVARIPKAACLTIKTSGASSFIEEAKLDGYLGLSAALMYEKSLGNDSPWAGYLQVLPNEESLPLLWTLDEVDHLLCGTELHKTVKEDIIFMYEDWKESILPLMDSSAMKLNPKYFGVEEYFSAKSLIASRSFEIDEYHGFGMVPLADLFNHKTGAEDVHFTSISSHTEFDDSSTDNDEIHYNTDDCKPAGLNFSPEKKESENILAGKGSDVGLNCSTLEDNPSVLQMIMIKDVKIGSEIFNTYGLLGNAALLHRYGFTEPNNSNDIVNIDLELVLQWSSALFSSRHSRARLSLWRRFDCAACLSQDSEYFEISYDGEPQIELLILLYTILLPENAYRSLDIAASNSGNFRTNPSIILCKKRSINSTKASKMRRELLLTKDVRKALISLADARERFYGSNSLKDDIESQSKCYKLDKKKYHSLMVRISERTILNKLRTYASSSCRSSTNVGRTSKRKIQKLS